MRNFQISVESPSAIAVFLDESDVLGIIGETLRLISQLDLGESLVIECIEDE